MIKLIRLLFGENSENSENSHKALSPAWFTHEGRIAIRRVLIYGIPVLAMISIFFLYSIGVILYQLVTYITHL